MLNLNSLSKFRKNAILTVKVVPIKLIIKEMKIRKDLVNLLKAGVQ